MPDQKWYYQHEGTVVGPCSTDELRRLASSRRLTPLSLVRSDEKSEWDSAGRIAGLFSREIAQHTPPPLPHERTSRFPELNATERECKGVQSDHTNRRWFVIPALSVVAAVMLFSGYRYLSNSASKETRNANDATPVGADAQRGDQNDDRASGESVSVSGRRSVDNGSPMEMATWSLDGKRIATAGVDGTIRIWNAETLRLEHELRHTPSEGLAECLFVAEDGSRLVTPTEEGVIQLWDVQSESVLETNQSSQPIIGITRSMWGDNFLVRQRLNRLGIHQVTDLQELSSFQMPVAVDWWTVLVLIPTRNLCAVISEDGDVVLVNMETTAIEERITPPETPSPSCLGVSRDGSRLAVGTRTGSVFVYDTTTWDQVCHCELQTYRAYSVAFSGDGKHIVTGGVDWSLRVWDAESGQLLKEHWSGKGQISSVVFSPDGSELLFTQIRSGQTLFVWSTSTLLD